MFRNNQNADFLIPGEIGCDNKIITKLSDAIFPFVSNYFMNQSFVTVNLQHNIQI